MTDNCRVVIGKTMNEVGGVGIRGLPVSPDSDCNSNHHGSLSYLSNTSSQDIDFIQDNSDYQWFLDYGYRDSGMNQHTSILSLPESYEANDLNYYDTLAKNMDANLAEADMESFRTEDIHALLTNLPPMCTDHLSQENNRQGECYASVSGSIMAKLDFDSSISPHSSSHGEDSANSTSISLYKSELLFSPLKDVPMPGANFSVDSLDCDMMLTCQANKDNYTIAFEGSVTMYSEDSEYHESDHKCNNSNSGSAHWPNDFKKHIDNVKTIDASMTQSDSGSLTTWSKLKKRNSDNQLRRHPSGNNNITGEETTNLGLNECSNKSQSMPNLHKQKFKNMLISNYLKSQSNSSDTCTVKRRPVKVFDIQHHIQNSSGSGASISDMATSIDASSSENSCIKQHQPNISLVKLFMKQKSISTEVMSTTMDPTSSTENWPASQSEESNSCEQQHNKNIEYNMDQKINDSSGRTYDLISEEPEEDISKNESVDQNKTDSSPKRISQKHNVNNNDSYVLDVDKMNKTGNIKYKNLIKQDLISKSIQTSQFSEMVNLKNAHKTVKDQQPYKIIEPSFLKKLKQEGEVQKPVYVLYPNYVLPNLDFLNEKQTDLANILLIPQEAPQKRFVKKRPFSCNDLEALKRKGFSHVVDWDSLNILLPQEYRNILSEVPEISEFVKTNNGGEKPFFTQHQRRRKRPTSCDYTAMLNHTNSLSSSSTATQPSSGYRGSSTILSDSQNSPALTTNLNPLFVYKYDSATSSEANSFITDRQKPITTTPPLPVRCVSFQNNDHLPPRPPLPKGILRRGLDKEDPHKRYSLYETSEEEFVDDVTVKRKSFDDVFSRNKRFSETEDEGVDAGTSSSSMDEHHEGFRSSSPNQYKDFLLSNISNDELVQLEEFLKISGISTSDHEEMNEENLMQLRSYVGKFLSLKINQENSEHFGTKKNVSFGNKLNLPPKHIDSKQFIAPNNSPNVSAFLNQRNYHVKTLADMPINEESEGSPSYNSPQTTPVHRATHSDLGEKRCLIEAVAEAVEQLISHFSLATNQHELNSIGDSSANPLCPRLVLSTICPALYAILSDGLKPSLESSFGAINNSVWRVVEASAQQGPLTKALNELVMRINSEDVITEGLVKFNAFVFGLLNVRSLDAWISYLRTRESILQKHYNKDSLLIMAQTGGPNCRALLDSLITTLQPLALLPFQLDLLFEYRQLHLSFKRMDSYQQQMSPSQKHSNSPNSSQWNNRSNIENNIDPSYLSNLLNSSGYVKVKCRSDKERPRSCVDSGMPTKPNFKLGDVTMAAKKRWSGISVNSKLYLVYDKLAKEDDEEYTDSLETGAHVKTEEEKTEHSNSNENYPSLQEDGPESLDSNISDDKPLNGRKFKKLQQKWEMLSGRESNSSPPLSPITTPNKSKIPRPITSPNKPSGIPLLISPTGKQSKLVKKPISNPVPKPPQKSNIKNSKSIKTTPTRTSRVDQMDGNNDTPRHIPRPSSLPYKAANTQNKASKVTPPRRAASSSLSRKPNNSKAPVSKVVRTLSHRVPAESGHLSYNEGERLKVVLEVDEKWLLCCRGTQKGLVPRSAVIADLGRI